MLNKFVLGSALCVTSICANANPSVSGNTISWPDDGWYQVQNQISFESVCEGGSSCMVATGDYIVINHSTGERFTDIRVGALNDDGNDTAIRVVDSVISWPDDGWYQVQRASDFGTECEGGRSCIVGPGFYNVINHTTGERFANVQVRTPSTDPSPINPPTNPPIGSPTSPISVNGNIVSWPDDGWYEVQNLSDYSNVCSGQRRCQVPVGEYVVINHTTGVRYEPIRVVTTEQAPGGNDFIDLVFDITVPAYMSDGLRVNVVWGDIVIDADFLNDESWIAIHTDGFPTNVELPLLITFSDDVSGLTLGTVERGYNAGSNALEALTITANDFDLFKWDEDRDTVSNLAELIAGTNPRDADDNPFLLDFFDPQMGTIALRAVNIEASISEDRPFFEDTQILPPPDATFNDPQTTDVVTIAIDASGNGTFFDSVIVSEEPVDRTLTTTVATRTNTGNAIEWSGTYERSDRSSGVATNADFRTVTEKIDDNTFSITGETNGDSVGTFDAEQIRTSFNLIGKRIEGSSHCEPTSGRYFEERRRRNGLTEPSKSTIFKRPDETEWLVSVSSANDGKIIEEYSVRSLGLTFFCDYVELR